MLWGSGGDGGNGGAVCVCAFGSVILTLNPTLTLFPTPDFCSVHTTVQNATPNRCGAMSKEEEKKTESRENMNPMLVTAETSHFVALRHLARAYTPSPSLTPECSSRVRLATPASTLLCSSGEPSRNAVRTVAGGFRVGAREELSLCHMNDICDDDPSGPLCLFSFTAGARASINLSWRCFCILVLWTARRYYDTFSFFLFFFTRCMYVLYVCMYVCMYKFF